MAVAVEEEDPLLDDCCRAAKAAAACCHGNRGAAGAAVKSNEKTLVCDESHKSNHKSNQGIIEFRVCKVVWKAPTCCLIENTMVLGLHKLLYIFAI